MRLDALIEFEVVQAQQYNRYCGVWCKLPSTANVENKKEVNIMKLTITLSGDKAEVIREAAAIRKYAESSQNDIVTDIEEEWDA
jgi:hypothetical protein